MPFGSPASGAQKAFVTVIESPNCAKVPGVPVNFAWTFFIGSTQAGSAARPADETRRRNNSATAVCRRGMRSPLRGRIAGGSRGGALRLRLVADALLRLAGVGPGGE